jgi:hypothetical protein
MEETAMLRSLRVLSLIALLIVISAMTISPVFACSPGEDAPRLKDKLKSVDLVFTGTVIGNDGAGIYEATHIVQVDSYLKGSGSGIVAITGFGDGGGDCRNYVAVGDTWLFFADGSADTGETLNASYEWVYDAVQPAEAEYIDAVVNIVGQSPAAPGAASIELMLKYLPYFPAFQVVLLVVVPLTAIGAVVFIALRLRREKRKRKNTG